MAMAGVEGNRGRKRRAHRGRKDGVAGWNSGFGGAFSTYRKLSKIGFDRRPAGVQSRRQIWFPPRVYLSENK